MTTKFKYDDIVRIQTNHPEKSQFNGREGCVLGISEPIGGGEPGYALYLESEKYGWNFMESELEATGKKREKPFHRMTEAANSSLNMKSKSRYDEPLLFTQKQILHSIHTGLSDADIALNEVDFEKLFRVLAVAFEIDPNYINMFVKSKMKKPKKR